MRKVLIIVGVLALVGLVFWLRVQKGGEIPSVATTGVPDEKDNASLSSITTTTDTLVSVPKDSLTPVIPPSLKSAPVKPPKPDHKLPWLKTQPSPKPKEELPAMIPPSMVPPPVEIHKELIPKNIEIIRVYYERSITGPGTTIEFDINGTGFTQEFQKMIWVESGSPDAAVKDLTLITPNQIHGFLVITRSAKTAVAFPQVLINGKVVFRAAEPFAMIRPGEVLNLVFTEMGESGRTGRFRIFTNLTESMYAKLLVVPSTQTIEVAGLTPMLPHIVDGLINVGATEGGGYALAVKLGEKVLWQREGIIRVVPPNVGQSGLIQRVMATDGFHRPGDQAKFLIQGSGFQPRDTTLLVARVKGWESTTSTFSFIAPGRMELLLDVPLTASTSSYSLEIFQGTEVLMQIAEAFSVVDRNWTRVLKLSPELNPGGTGSLVLNGRDMDADFIASLEVEVDDPGLVIGKFSWLNPQEASAPIAIGPHVVPGDYLVTITSRGNPIAPRFGSIIRVGQKK